MRFPCELGGEEGGLSPSINRATAQRSVRRRVPLAHPVATKGTTSPRPHLLHVLDRHDPPQHEENHHPLDRGRSICPREHQPHPGDLTVKADQPRSICHVLDRWRTAWTNVFE